MTPLHLACSKGHLLIAELLFEAGAEVNVIDEVKCSLTSAL